MHAIIKILSLSITALFLSMWSISFCLVAKKQQTKKNIICACYSLVFLKDLNKKQIFLFYFAVFLS